MNRRGFIGALVGGVATAAAVRTWPFRVFSFPTEVQLPQFDDYYGITYYMNKDQAIAWQNLAHGSGSRWIKGPDGLPICVRRGQLVVTDVDQQHKTITLANLRNGLKILREEF